MHQRSLARALRRAVCGFGLIGGGILAVSSPAQANLTIVPHFDSSITSDPNAATIEAGINATIARVEAHILNPLTVNITFQVGNIGGGAVGTSNAAFTLLPDYATYHSALQTGQILSANDNTALATLPAGINNPTTGGSDMQLSAALARALGLPTDPASSDGTITLDTSLMNLSRTGPQNPNLFDLQAIAGHEIDEILGLGGTGSQLTVAVTFPTGATIGPEDLFRFSAAGVRSFTPFPATAYFSIDGGVTNIANFYNQNGPEDYGDWGSGATPRIQDAIATPGVQVDIGPAELIGLDVIGWNLAPVPGISLASAVSRRSHGAAGTFDVALPLSGTPASEPRQGGLSPQIVLTFSAPPTAGGATPTCTNVAVINATCSGVSVSGNDLIVSLAGLTKNTCLTVAVQGIDGMTADNDVSVLLHEGDVNGSGAVNILDLQATKNDLNQPVTAANFKLDVTCNGSINILDLQATKNNLNQPAACP